MSSEPAGGEAIRERALDVVIVAYRSRELLRECLRSLRAHPPSIPLRVVVVDNDSRDGTAEMVAAEYAEVDLIESGSNLGFATAANLGASRGDGEFLLALNPDTAVTEGALDAVISALESDPDAAVAGPRLLRLDGSFDHAARRSFPTPLSALGHFSGVGRRPGAHSRLAAYRAPEVESGPVDAVNGAFMLVRRGPFERVGGFDEGYWMYMEDLDLCYRLAQAGYVSWYEPSATALHVKGGSTGGLRSPRLEWAFHRGMYRFYRAHYAGQRSLVLNAAVYAGITAKLALALAQSALWRSRERRRQRRRSVPASEGPPPSNSSPG